MAETKRTVTESLTLTAGALTKKEDFEATSVECGENPAAVESDITDEEVLEKAKDHLRLDQVLAAARWMKKLSEIPDSEIEFQKEVDKKAALINHVISDLLADPEVHEVDDANEATVGSEKWIKMGETHGNRDTVAYYQLTEDLQLKCRLESPIESSLLVPLLSVLIETDLFTTWMPSWNYPRIGLESVNKFAEMSRTEQVIQFIAAVPWPFRAREVILHTLGCDDIHDIEGNTTGSIAIGLVSMDEGDQVKKSKLCGSGNPHYRDAPDVIEIPPIPDGLKRAEFDGGLLIRACPADHAALKNSKTEYSQDEHMILVSFSMHVDAKISSMFPMSLINFVIKTVIVQMWNMFLKVAEEIRAGSRPQHAAAIAAHREVRYDWIEKRIEDMFTHLDHQKEVSQGADNADNKYQETSTVPTL